MGGCAGLGTVDGKRGSWAMGGFFFLRVFALVFLAASAVSLAPQAAFCQENREEEAVSDSSRFDELYAPLDLFGDVLEITRLYYLKETETVKLIGAAMDGMLASLDPHSAYLDEKEFEELKTFISSQFGGLGIQVTLRDGLVEVISPIDGTPAARAGVMSGDRFTHLDGVSVFGMTLGDAVKKMRGEPGSSILLTIRREGLGDLVELKLIREIIRVRPVRHRVEGEDVGYVRITSFNEETKTALEKAFLDIRSKVEEETFKGYILDLRNNPGGLLQQAVEVADMFLDGGEVVSTRGRGKASVQRYNARKGVLIPPGVKVLVLVNGGSASASEIVAGALQDRKRALVLGTKTFGKGSVQTIMPLGAYGALRITTARYYTPSGRSIQAKGVEPDILVEQELPDELEGKIFARPSGESDVRGHLEAEKLSGAGEAEENREEEESDGEEDGGKREGSGSLSYVPLDPRRDIQLNYALDLLRGRKELETAAEEGGR